MKLSKALQLLMAAGGLAAAPLPAPTLAQAPAASAAAEIPQPPPGMKEKAETALRSTIAAFEAGNPNFDEMETPLADAVRQQSGTLTAMITQLGALKAVDYQAWNPKGPGVAAFLATFANGRAQCLIGFGPGGKIQTLWFRPV